MIAGALISASGVNAPYISGAEQNGEQIDITWRNNDIETESFLIIRKIAGMPFEVIDSVSGITLQYHDITVAASTGYFYAVLAAAQGIVSDTSNVVSITSAPPVVQCIKPRIKYFYFYDTCAVIYYYDSCTIETGYRIHRNEYPGSESFISTQTDSAPSARGVRSFTDTGVSPNKMYKYKVEAFNDSLSVSSDDTLIYTYREPPVTHGYNFLKVSEFPINPAGCVEKAGDSILVVENTGNSSGAVAVIDIGDQAHPSFKGYLKPDSLPVSLQNTELATCIRFGIRMNPPWERKLLSNGRYGIYLRADTLIQYDFTVDAPVDSIIFNSGEQNRIIGRIDDSLFLLNVSVRGLSKIPDRLYLCKFSPSGLDTVHCFPLEKTTTSGSDGGTWYYHGFHEKRAYFTSTQHFNFTPALGEYYHIYDYSITAFSPLHFKFGAIPVSNSSGCLLDSSVSFSFKVYQDTLFLNTFDIRSALSVTLSSYTDPGFKGGTIEDIIVDSVNNRLFVFAKKSFAIYEYDSDKIGVSERKSSKISERHVPDGLLTRPVSNGILINTGNRSGEIEGVYIFNLAGRMVRKLSSSLYGRSPLLLWDKKDTSGSPLSAGFYFLMLKYAKGVKCGRAIVIR